MQWVFYCKALRKTIVIDYILSGAKSIYYLKQLMSSPIIYKQQEIQFSIKIVCKGTKYNKPISIIS